MTYRFFLFVLFLFLASCANKNVYHWDIAARNDTYVENYGVPLSSQITSMTGKTTTTLSGDNNGVRINGSGVTIGLLETTQSNLSSRIAFTYTRFNATSYTFNIATIGTVNETITTGSMAFDGSIGYSWKYIRLYGSYLIDSRTYEVVVSPATSGLASSTGTITFWGFGIDLTIPYNKKDMIYLSYQVRPANTRSSSTTANLTSIELGFRF